MLFHVHINVQVPHGIDQDTLLYQFTVNDPQSFQKPWSAELPMKRAQGPIFEYACHEGNSSVVNTLNAARAEEKAAEALQREPR